VQTIRVAIIHFTLTLGLLRYVFATDMTISMLQTGDEDAREHHLPQVPHLGRMWNTVTKVCGLYSLFLRSPSTQYCVPRATER
jgi:hypothetical protein